jgi:hypothetical protein
MIAQLRTLAVRLSLSATLVAAAAFVGGWKWGH